MGEFENQQIFESKLKNENPKPIGVKKNMVTWENM
jgi:hypothetical protein